MNILWDTYCSNGQQYAYDDNVQRNLNLGVATLTNNRASCAHIRQSRMYPETIGEAEGWRKVTVWLLLHRAGWLRHGELASSLLRPCTCPGALLGRAPSHWVVCCHPQQRRRRRRGCLLWYHPCWTCLNQRCSQWGRKAFHGAQAGWWPSNYNKQRRVTGQEWTSMVKTDTSDQQNKKLQLYSAKESL